MWVQIVRSCLVFALALSGDSGQDRTPVEKPPAVVTARQKRPARREWLVTTGALRDNPQNTRLIDLAGHVDVSNRYPGAVLVTAELDEQDEGGVCSGVLLSHRLVLTAGHCVCPARREPSASGAAQTVMDASRCTKTARVTTSFYSPRSALGDDTYSLRHSHLGAVLPHPEFRIVLDAQQEVLSSSADLALIVLDEPLDPKYKPLPLSDEELQPNESVLVVGSGYDELAGMYDGERRSSYNHVTELTPFGGRVLIEQPGGHHYRGDSGGPCLREGPNGVELVGISSRNLGEGGAITSTYPYRDWLRSELQRVESLPLPSRTRTE